MNLNVLIVTGDNIENGAIGGKNTHIRLLEMGFSHYGINHNIIFPPDLIPRMKYTEYFECFIKYGIFPIKNDCIRHTFKLMKYLKAEIERKDIKPDIIHCQDVISLLAIKNAYKFSKNKIPILLTVHGYFTQEFIDNSQNYSKNSKNLLSNYGMKVEKEAIENSSKIIAVDSRIKEYLIKEFHINSELITILPNATDINKFSPISEQNKCNLREKKGYSKKDIIILVPRRLVPKNGVEYAIDAIKSISNGNVKLLIAGDGPLLAKLESKSDRDERIQFLGAISYNEIDEYYKLSDIILIPSITSNNIQEATSISMLEGMACEKYVICSNIGGMKEIIKERTTGFLVEEKNPDMIANIIQMILTSNDNLSYIKTNARKYIEENHSYISHSYKHISLYRDVLGEKINL